MCAHQSAPSCQSPGRPGGRPWCGAGCQGCGAQHHEGRGGAGQVGAGSEPKPVNKCYQSRLLGGEFRKEMSTQTHTRLCVCARIGSSPDFPANMLPPVLSALWVVPCLQRRKQRAILLAASSAVLHSVACPQPTSPNALPTHIHGHPQHPPLSSHFCSRWNDVIRPHSRNSRF